MVRISGDFWVNFNDGNSLRSTFLLSPEHIFCLNKSPDHILRPYFIPEHRDFGKSYWNQALFQNKQSISQHFWVLCIPTAITGTCQKPKIQWIMGSIGSDRTPAFRKAWTLFEFWSFWSHTSKRILPDFLSICILLAFAFVYWFFLVFWLSMALQTPQWFNILSTYFASLLLNQCTPSTGNLKRATTTRIWNSAVNHMLEASTKALCTLTASTFAEKNKSKYVVLVSCVCIFKLAVKRN